mmetsp:Transcript_28153/g.42606  ORF Transcript_28153/g.42606 Transcript_28153/m.42606 type:complete len:94 (+) Transcript_28153:802-1083(+)
MGCFFYAISKRTRKWKPASWQAGDFYEAPTRLKYLHSLYAATMALTGNEVDPVDEIEIAYAFFMTVTGAVLMAVVLGAAAAIFSEMNRKKQRF